MGRLSDTLDRVAAVTDRLRVRAHLWRAERRLRYRSGDGPARERLLNRLRSYRRTGRFPRNPGGGRTPLFRDDRGARCAVADLAAVTGRSDVVETVARRDNAVDLATEEPPPALAAWLADVPLSRSEAALVQPTYGGGGAFTRGCLVLSCEGVRALVHSWALVTVFLLEGVVYLLADRLGVGRTVLRRGGVLAVAGVAGTGVAGTLALVVAGNV